MVQYFPSVVVVCPTIMVADERNGRERAWAVLRISGVIEFQRLQKDAARNWCACCLTSQPQTVIGTSTSMVHHKNRLKHENKTPTSRFTHDITSRR